MDPQYQAWYNSVFPQPAQGPAPGPPQMTPQQVTDFYRSVGITSPVGQPPATRTVQSVPVNLPPIPASVEDRVTARNRVPLPERATTIATYQTPSISDYVRGRTLAPVPDRLPTGVAGMPANFGTFSPQQVAQIGVPAGGTQPPLRITVDGANPIQTAKVAPVPFTRPTAVGTALDTKPMPPMPIPRPKTAPVPFPRPDFGMGGPEGPAAPSMLPFGLKLPSLPQIPEQMQTIAGRTAAMDSALKGLFAGTPRVNAGSGGYNAREGVFNTQNLPNPGTRNYGFSGSNDHTSTTYRDPNKVYNRQGKVI